MKLKWIHFFISAFCLLSAGMVSANDFELVSDDEIRKFLSSEFYSTARGCDSKWIQRVAEASMEIILNGQGQSTVEQKGRTITGQFTDTIGTTTEAIFYLSKDLKQVVSVKYSVFKLVPHRGITDGIHQERRSYKGDSYGKTNCFVSRFK